MTKLTAGLFRARFLRPRAEPRHGRHQFHAMAAISLENAVDGDWRAWSRHEQGQPVQLGPKLSAECSWTAPLSIRLWRLRWLLPR